MRAMTLLKRIILYRIPMRQTRHMNCMLRMSRRRFLSRIFPLLTALRMKKRCLRISR